MGFSFISLPDNFELIGHGKTKEIKGGING